MKDNTEYLKFLLDIEDEDAIYILSEIDEKLFAWAHFHCFLLVVLVVVASTIWCPPLILLVVGSSIQSDNLSFAYLNSQKSVLALTQIVFFQSSPVIIKS